VYSAKAFAVVLGLLAEGFDRPIVFWHTGGLPSALLHLTAERSTLCPT
jgi:1-aminocyclopropane-1-carboxylate deaminase/D-cysteine desulfhydrase-like pyridoxal-dependent ACC family enzyme